MSENTKQNYLNHPKGIMSWLLTLDHKRIGLMYLFSGILFFFLGGLLSRLDKRRNLGLNAFSPYERAAQPFCIDQKGSKI